MAVIINEVKPFSKCWFFGVRAGDKLVSIDSKEVDDVLDYDFYMSFLPVEMEFLTSKGKTVRIKATDENVGIKFETFLMDKQHSCRNKCIFCFIDQLPKGMRESLYFKDDDSRLSFLFGNYVTLTNLTEHELRVKMMNNKNAGKCLSIIKRFADAGIKINAQLVLCPGVNDGEELRFSLTELAKMYPSVQSIAAVPVGLTKFRDGLYPLKPYNKQTAGETIDIIEEFSSKFKAENGIRLAYPADEFFLLAGREMPQEEYYDEYPQIDNGVGLWTSLRDEFYEAVNELDVKPVNREITLATGKGAYPLMCELARVQEEKFGVKVNVVEIINNFFGENITVAGLLTGTDLIAQLKDKPLGDCLLIPLVMTIDYTSHSTDKNKFLDDITLKQAEKELNIKIVPTQNDGTQLLKNILGVE